MGIRYTEEQRVDFVNRVNALRETGILSPEACKQVGVSYASYKNWQWAQSRAEKISHKKKKKTQATLVSIPMPPETSVAHLTKEKQLIIMMGGESQVLSALQYMSAIAGER